MTLPARAQCCGLAHMNAGDRATAKRLAKETIAMLEQTTARHIVSTSASCTVAMTQDYPHLLRDEPAWAARAAKPRKSTRWCGCHARPPAAAASSTTV